MRSRPRTAMDLPQLADFVGDYGEDHRDLSRLAKDAATAYARLTTAQTEETTLRQHLDELGVALLDASGKTRDTLLANRLTTLNETEVAEARTAELDRRFRHAERGLCSAIIVVATARDLALEAELVHLLRETRPQRRALMEDDATRLPGRGALLSPTARAELLNEIKPAQARIAACRAEQERCQQVAGLAAARAARYVEAARRHAA